MIELEPSSAELLVTGLLEAGLACLIAAAVLKIGIAIFERRLPWL